MSVINANSSKVELIRFNDLSADEVKLIGDQVSTVYNVDYTKMSNLHAGKFTGVDYRFARISFAGKPVKVGQILVPIMSVGPNEELWSVLFCPPGKVTEQGDPVFCENDEQLEISLHGITNT